jgi:hypothetical protein
MIISMKCIIKLVYYKDRDNFKIKEWFSIHFSVIWTALKVLNLIILSLTFENEHKDSLI